MRRRNFRFFAFHLEWPGSTLEEQNAATRELLERVTRRGKVMLTGCDVGGRQLARVCVLSFRTRRERIDLCAQQLGEEARTLSSGRVIPGDIGGPRGVTRGEKRPPRGGFVPNLDCCRQHASACF